MDAESDRRHFRGDHGHRAQQRRLPRGGGQPPARRRHVEVGLEDGRSAPQLSHQIDREVIREPSRPVGGRGARRLAAHPGLHRRGLQPQPAAAALRPGQQHRQQGAAGRASGSGSPQSPPTGLACGGGPNDIHREARPLHPRSRLAGRGRRGLAANPQARPGQQAAGESPVVPRQVQADPLGLAPPWIERHAQESEHPVQRGRRRRLAPVPARGEDHRPSGHVRQRLAGRVSHRLGLRRPGHRPVDPPLEQQTQRIEPHADGQRVRGGGQSPSGGTGFQCLHQRAGDGQQR